MFYWYQQSGCVVFDMYLLLRISFIKSHFLTRTSCLRINREMTETSIFSSSRKYTPRLLSFDVKMCVCVCVFDRSTKFVHTFFLCRRYFYMTDQVHLKLLSLQFPCRAANKCVSSVILHVYQIDWGWAVLCCTVLDIDAPNGILPLISALRSYSPYFSWI